MAGLYVHIPFCQSRCVYCGFYSTTRLDQRQRYVDALCSELAMRGVTPAGGEPPATVYLGGGTPSQLTAAQLRQLFGAIPTSEATEVTIEANPDDVTDELADLLAQLPVNRVSMGAQTFDDRRLRFLHRRHTASQVPLAVNRLRQAGIENISIDLMYGFPDETLDAWERDIDQALELNVEHLSAYALMYEEGTPLYRQLAEHAVEEVDEELSLQMYERLIDRLTAAGFEHYEISNFAKPGRRSRHNSSYWQQVPYIGVGAAAHSYDGESRQWNVADLSIYIKGVASGQPIVEREELDAPTRYNDTVMLRLRTREGLPLDLLTADERRYCLDAARRFLADGQLVLVDGSLRLTRRGLFVSDMVTSELMQV